MSKIYNHIKQLRETVKKAELNKAKNSTEYEYIYTRQQLLDSWLEKMEDLKYPLRVEPKRDRYVMNRKAMEQALTKACEEALNDMEKDITLWINTDVASLIQETAEEVLNSIVVENNHFVSKPTKTKNKKSWAEKLGEHFGKALAKSIMSYFDDMVNGKRK